MNTRQNYGLKRAESNPVEPTAAQSPDTLSWPLLIVQAQTVGGDLIHSEVQLVHASLLYYRDFLKEGGSGSATEKANLDTVNELIGELQNLCFEGLSDLALRIGELTERRS